MKDTKTHYIYEIYCFRVENEQINQTVEHDFERDICDATNIYVLKHDESFFGPARKIQTDI